MSKQIHKTVPVAKGDETEIEIINPAYGGGGVGRACGFTVFVRNAIPGSAVICRIEEVKKNYARGSAVKTIKESSDYTPSNCPYFGECGGCGWFNIKYEAQMRFKKGFLDRELEKNAGEEKKTASGIKECRENLYYRNRAQYKISEENGVFKMGFYRDRSHEVIDIEKCLIVDEKINETATVIKEALAAPGARPSVYDEASGKGCLRHICIRVNGAKEVLAAFVVRDESGKEKLKKTAAILREKVQGLKGVVLNINPGKGNRVFGDKETVLEGESFITENINGVDFKLASDTFFQVNEKMFKEMLGFIEKHLYEGAKVLDFYGGVGALTLPFHGMLKSITVAEINERSINMLKDIIKENRIKNAFCAGGDAADSAGELLKKENPDIIIFDPPRKGIQKDVIEEVKKAGTENIIYISCDPVTFARDIKEFREKYNVEEIVPLDMFPHTYHLETMCFMKVKKNG
ncbi:MAG TPA: 23S rRNA (uracil(1939)-C(5))-methyltransferase RlmD [Firmicutes bacterium]|nr:23S rRNA (uracil(1939)-C(5))-methyltransferase RlmD [Bacillota bacterium]